jgi:DHA2 family multidrug resistance protein
MSIPSATDVQTPPPFKIDGRVISLTVMVMLATIMQALDTTIANVALPHMQGSMNAAQDQITWVLTSYVVTAAIFTSLTGFLVTRFGRTRIFLISIIGFTFASMLCGAAQSLEQIVIFRMLQGAMGAMLVPLSQAVLMDIYPKERHGAAMAVWGMGVMVGPILGPTIGGYLTEYYSWRWVFYVNLPFGILAALGVWWLLPETKRQPNFRFDLLGFALIGVAVGSFQMMLDRGTTLDWFSSLEIIIEAVLAALAFYLFTVHMFTAKAPFLSPEPFRDRNYAVGLILSFVMGIALFATMALLPGMLQGLLGYPVMTTGLILMPRGIGTLFAMMLVGKLVRTVDARWLIMLGFGLTAVSMWQMAGFSLNVNIHDLVTSGMLQGFGIGLIFVPLTTIAFATLDSRFRTESAALFALVRSIGSSIGISGVATLLHENTQTSHSDIVAHITPFSRPLQALAPNVIWSLQGGERGLAALAGEINKQAAMVAYVSVFQMMAYMVLAAMPIVLLLKPIKKSAMPEKIEMVVEA